MHSQRSWGFPASQAAACAALALAIVACDSPNAVEPRSALLRPDAVASDAKAPIVAKVGFLADSGVDRKAWTVTVGQKAFFSGYAYDASGKLLSPSTVKITFKSSNPKVFPVDSITGDGTAIATGSFQLTVKASTVSATGGLSAVAPTTTVTTPTTATTTTTAPTTTPTTPTTTPTTSPTTTTTSPTTPTTTTTTPTPTTTTTTPTTSTTTTAPLPSSPSDSLFVATYPKYVARVKQGFEDVWTADGAAWGGNAQMVHGGGGDYYDRVSSLYQFAALSDFSTVAATYRQRAAAMGTDYGVNYLDPNKCGASPHWSQLDGLYTQWKQTGDTASARRVRCTADILALAYPYTSTYLNRVNGEPRMLGRVLLAQVLAWRVARDQGDATGMAKYATRRSTYFGLSESWIQPDGSFPSDGQVCGGQLNYMVGILTDALIQAQTDDATLASRALTVVRQAYTYIRDTQRRTDGSLNYASVVCTLNTHGLSVGSPTAAPDLDLDHVGQLAWLGARTGDRQWTAFADQLFADGTARGYWYGGKQFNELVQFGAKYLVLRGVR